MKILIAEDDDLSRTILERSVEKLGYEYVSAPDGGRAWGIYRESPDIDAVISDWRMPGMDGGKLCARVRRHAKSRGGYTFFVFLTTLADKGHFLDGMRAGADSYLAKPLNRDALRACLIGAERVTSLHKELMEQKRELERLNEKLIEQAEQDPLTRLGNRQKLRDDLVALRDRVRRYGHNCCVILCDLDFFKSHNDHYGHLAGDEVLRKVAGVISANLRASDTAYRYGGEEFLVILPEQNTQAATVAAERLRRKVEELAIPSRAAGDASEDDRVVTVSVGLSRLAPGEHKTMHTLIKEADVALYEAKRRGRNRVEIHGA